MEDALSWIIRIASYLVYTWPLYIIAKKSGHEYAWLAWVPFANFWLMCDMADISILWAIPCIIIFPLMFFLYIALWWRISENTNKPGWLGILMVIPIVDLFVAYYMAYVEPKDIR